MGDSRFVYATWHSGIIPRTPRQYRIKNERYVWPKYDVSFWYASFQHWQAKVEVILYTICCLGQCIWLRCPLYDYRSLKDYLNHIDHFLVDCSPRSRFVWLKVSVKIWVLGPWSNDVSDRSRESLDLKPGMRKRWILVPLPLPQKCSSFICGYPTHYCGSGWLFWPLPLPHPCLKHHMRA